MPAILTGEAIEQWLNTRDVGVKEAISLARPPPAGAMKYHPVGRAVGNANNEGPELIAPIDPDAEDDIPAKPRRKAANSGQLDLF